MLVSLLLCFIRFIYSFRLFVFHFHFQFLSEIVSKDILHAADYHALPNRKIQKFGDIIGMATGRLEINEHGGAAIVELPENCIKLCADEYLAEKNVSGVWSVEKIRHRDENRGHRYELKITIRAMKKYRFDTKRDAIDANGNGLSKARSFLIKDEDYPKYFSGHRDTHIEQRKSNQRVEKRIFNILYDNTEIPFHLNYGRSPNIPLVYGLGQDSHLNIGEYYMGRPAVPSSSFHSRPLRFGGGGPHPPPNGLPSNGPNPLTPGQLHHHYYLNKDEVPIYKASLFENGNVFGQHAAHGPVVLPNQMPNHQYSTIRNPQSQRIENQIRPNEYFNSFTPTPSIPVQFPGTESDDAAKYRGSVNGVYDENRETILEGEHHKYVGPQFDVTNNLLNFSPPQPAKQNSHVSTANGHGITPTPYVFQIDASPSPAPISFYSNPNQNQHQQHHPQSNHVQPSSVYSSQQLANQFYWFGDGHQQPRNPNAHFESSYPFHENTFSELDPVYHGHGQDQSISVTPGNIVSVQPTTGFERDSNREASQLPHQHSSIGYTVSSEDQSTTQENTEPNFTTPYVLSTTKTFGKQHSNDGKPDSINAQLPPPDADDDLTVPYVDASIHTEKPYAPIRLIERPVEHRHIAHSKTEYVTTENRNDEIVAAATDVPNKMEKIFDSDHRTPIQVRYKSQKNTNAAEKQTVKWTPKRTRQRKPATENENERKATYRHRKVSTTTTTATPTVTSSDTEDTNPEIITAKSVFFHDEPRTSQSVKKTVSIRIGDNEDIENVTNSSKSTTVAMSTTTTSTPATTTTSTDTPESHTFISPNSKPFMPTAMGRSNVTRLAMIKRVDGQIRDSDRIIAKRTRYLG